MKSPAGIDRSPQALPVPLGDMAPVHARVTARGALRARVRDWALSVSGIVLSIIGVVLAAGSGGVSVYEQGAELHVGGTVLHEVAQSTTQAVYSGDATYTLTTLPGHVSAVARWEQAGATASVSCREVTGGGMTTVACLYVGVGDGFASSTDVFDAAAGTWHRTYDDGVRVNIPVPAGATAVPVAFPVGR